jgi:hypothetical protein
LNKDRKPFTFNNYILNQSDIPYQNTKKNDKSNNSYLN